MKKTLMWCIKAIIAGCLAFAVLTGFCVFYYNIPVHTPNDTGATDYKWTPNTFFSRGTEGFAWGRTNNEGFVNAIDYQQGMPIDILIMGSSHMEAFHVGQKKSTAGRLEAALPDMTTYNIGVADHPFLVCSCNLNAALETYHPQGYVVIETSRIAFSNAELQSAMDGTVPELADRSSGILSFLSGNQYLRLMLRQLRGFMGQNEDDEDVASSGSEQEAAGDAPSEALLDELLAKMSGACRDEGVQLIIMYHPTTGVDADGSLLLPDDASVRASFDALCQENGVIFLDMTERFEEEYVINHVLPHGFINSSIGSGHLNEYGHEMIADELLQIIQ